MSVHNTNDDDFDVDYSDDLGYESSDSSHAKKKVKRVAKTSSTTSKKEIKVEIKRKKRSTPRSKEVKKTTKKEPVVILKKSSKEEKVTKKVNKEPLEEKAKKKLSSEDKKIKVATKKKKTTSKTVEPKEEQKPFELEKKKKKPVVEEEIEKISDDFDENVEVEVEEPIEYEIVEEKKEPEKEVEEKVIEEKPIKVVEEIKEEKPQTEEIDLSDIPLSKIFKAKFAKLFRKLKRNRKPAFISLAVLFVLIVSFVLVKTGIISISLKHSISKKVEPVTIETSNTYHDTWQSYEDINPDYVGQIIFDSELINKPFVQAKSCYKENGVPYKFYNQDGSIVADFSEKTGNDVYIWMDFETMTYDYDNKGGSIFMDYRNTLSDQNIIIYGHYFSTIYNKDPDRVKSFTPLEKLLEKENYKDNQRLKIVLENEIRTYDLYAVYKFDSDNDEYWEKAQYFRPNYNIDDFTGEEDSNYMKNYIDFINSVRLYKTDVSLNPGDSTLTLQTCMTPYTNLYQICVFKLVDTSSY